MQTSKDFEVIFCDDNSKKQYKEIFYKELEGARFDYRVIENDENKGAGLARNKALQLFQGDYFLFIDSDDAVNKNLIQYLNNIIKNNKVDIILFDMMLERKKYNEIINTLKGFNNGYVSKEDVIAYATSCVAGKCYSKRIYDPTICVFPALRRYEDWVFEIICFKRSSVFYYLKEPLYHYISNEESVVNRYSDSALMYAKEAHKLISNIDIGENLKNFLYMKEVGYLTLKNVFLGRGYCADDISKIKSMNDLRWERFIVKNHLNRIQYYILSLCKLKIFKNIL